MAVAEVGLLERERELAVLDEAFARVATSGRGELVIVTGEAGIGKSALIRCHCDAHSGEARVLWGACEPLFSPSPFGPVVEIAQACGEPLRGLLASGASPHEVTLAVVEELRRRAPSIVVFEDVHWADDATLDLLRLLGRRHAGVPALIVVGYRDSEIDRYHPLRRALGELAPARLQPAPLSLAAVRTLAAESGLDAEALHRLSGGNPFFVSEAVESGKELPTSVREAVLARASRLTREAWGLLEVVAVSSVPAELWLLEEIDADAFAAAEEACMSGMLVAEAGTLRFRHELSRLAVLDEVAPDRRLMLERASLRTLESAEAAAGRSARLAHHAEAAGDADAVLRHAPEAAAQAAAVGAHREAAAQYARALRFAAALPAAQSAKLCERRSFECYLTNQFAQAQAATEQAIGIYRELGDAVAVANSSRWLGLVHLVAGATAEAFAAVDEAVSLLEQLPPSDELAVAYAAAAAVRMLSEDEAETADWATKAIELACRLGNDDAYLAAAGSLGAVQALHGSSEGRQRLEQVFGEASGLGLDNHVARMYVLMGMGACRERSLARMAQIVEAGITFAEQRDLPLWGRYLLAMRSWLELERGAWDRAGEMAELVLAQPCALSNLQARVVLGLVRARRGDPDSATPLAEADEVARKTGQLWWMSQVAAARAEAAWLQGCSDQVAAATEDAFRLACSLGAPWPAGELALWRRRSGLVEEPPPDVAEPFALQLRGEWQRAAEVWTRMGCPYEAALALAEADEPAALRSGLEQLRMLDARPAAEILARRLRQLGVAAPRGRYRAARANPAQLTARELEVLELLAEGLSNAAIADRLVVSRRTVDHHVSAILRKLRVTDRHQAVAEATALGVVPKGG